ncbi:MAG: hypothetical protein FWH51_00810 [Dehalococcoidia bacterium]|nr:hypothetical protein [Dehalococcoidia bacterium]
MVILGGRRSEPETCPAALHAALVKMGGRASAHTLFEQVERLGHWTKSHIWQTMFAHTVNIPASYHLFGLVTPDQRFIFLREDGNYELYDGNWHGRYEMGKRVI